ncbi:hypothetical protein [Patulibacter medicamentivorans]|uniref:hypothetical protein n=1 Tax=Patulibacter medicamentivorans TaxID=1097667 RepID=UPI0005913C40|nr:hypothetical protein [Patulibacter medicamentivorans]
MSTAPLPPFDPRAGTCAACGAILAADQRYCLTCGARRDGARLPYRDALAAEPAQQQVLPAPVAYYAPGGAGGTSPTLLTTLAALACVLLAFGVGVLVGGQGDDQQPVVVGGGVPQASAPTTTEAAATATDTTADEADASSNEDSSGDEGDSATPSKPKAAPKKVVEESKKALKALDQAKTPKEAAEASENLPDVVVTGDGDPNAGK